MIDFNKYFKNYLQKFILTIRYKSFLGVCNALVLFILCTKLLANFKDIMPPSPVEISSLNSNLVIDSYVSVISGQLVLPETDLAVRSTTLALTSSYEATKLLGSYADNYNLYQFMLGKALFQLNTKKFISLGHLWAGYNLHSPYFQLRDPQGYVLEFEIVEDRDISKTAGYGREISV